MILGNKKKILGRCFHLPKGTQTPSSLSLPETACFYCELIFNLFSSVYLDNTIVNSFAANLAGTIIYIYNISSEYGVGEKCIEMVKNERFLESVMTLQSTPIELNGFYRAKTPSVTLPGQYNIFNPYPANVENMVSS